MMDIAQLHKTYVRVMTTSDRSRHVTALELFRARVAEQMAEEETEKALERLLVDYHRVEAARQFAKSREDQSFSPAPDPSKPPGLSYYPTGALLTESPEPRTAYQVLDSVAPNYRYRYRLRRRVQNDLARFSALFGGRVWLQIFDERDPIPTFERLIVTSWLAAGGRAWIVAELDHLGARRVIPFRGRAHGET
jgi:hypothetical protein